jgi:hypothetical protein
MLLATVGLVMGYHAIKYGESTDPYFNKMLAIGAFAVLVLFAFMRVSHKGVALFWSKPSKAIRFFVRIALSFAHLGMWWYDGHPVVPMTVHAAISVVVNLIDIFVTLRYKNRILSETSNETELVAAPPEVPSSTYIGDRRSASSAGISVPSKIFPGRRVWQSDPRGSNSSRSTSLAYYDSSTTSPLNDQL